MEIIVAMHQRVWLDVDMKTSKRGNWRWASSELGIPRSVYAYVTKLANEVPAL